MPVYGWVAFGILATGLVVLLIGGDSNTIMGATPGQLGALTAMLALLVYLGGGMLGKGQKIGPLIKQLAVWGLMLLALLVGYWVFQSYVA
ncbi:MAG: hypothetical protein AB8B88_03775 [Devosiaceae bacterium]